MILNLVAYEEMLDEAFLNGAITEEEYHLLNNVSINYGIYEKDVHKAMEDGIIDETESEHLRAIRKAIYENALRTSLKNGVITGEETKILNILKDSVGLGDTTLGRIERSVKIEVKYPKKDKGP